MGTSRKIVPFSNNCHEIRIDKVLNALFWVSLVVCVPKFMMTTGIYSNIFSSIIRRISMYSDMAREYYMDRQELASVTGIWKVINIATVIIGPFYWAYLSLSMLFWGKLPLFKKILTLLIYVIYVGQYVCTGTNVGVFNFMVFICVVFIIRRRESNPRRKSFFKTRKIRIASIIAAVAFVIIFLAFFNTTMESRRGETYEWEGATSVCSQNCPINRESFLYQITPKSFRPLLLTATSYVAKPYAALSFEFDLPFHTTLGVGYSWFLLDNLPFSRELWERTYPRQLEQVYNYSSWVNWHTAYTWFANDVSWLGVPVIMFFLFWLFGLSWKRYILTGDLLSFLMFMLFVRFMLFVSMNNQVFQQSETLLAFWGIIFIRLFSKPIRVVF